MAINRDLMSKGLDALGLPSTGSQANSLLRYLEEIELWNPAYGLVAATGDDLVVKHALDSLAPWKTISTLPGPSSADIGSGAGLPGIPLAIFLPDRRFHLVERMARRCGFLRNQVAILGLSNTEVIEAEAERTPGNYDLIVFRAFRPFEGPLFAKIKSKLAIGGRIAAYKGKKEKAIEELDELPGLFSSRAVIDLKVPFLDEDRCLIILGD